MDEKFTLTCMNQAMAQRMGGEYVCEDEWGEEYPSSLPCDEEACIAACSTCGEQFDCDESHFCDWITCSVCYTQYMRGQGHSCTVVGDNNENENSGNNGSGESGGSFGTGGGSNTGGNNTSNESSIIIEGGTDEQKATIKSIVSILSNRYNVYMKNIAIAICNDDCSSSARLNYDYNKIEICPQFFQHELKDQTAILWHETYHYHNDDKTWKDIPFYSIDDFVASPSEEDVVQSIEYMIEHYDCIPRELYGTLSWNIAYNSWVTISQFRNYPYTQNEINTYSKEIEIFQDVSEYYANERIVLLWQHKERLKKYPK